MTDRQAQIDPWKAIQRFDLVSIHFAYTADHEMQRDVEGDWARWEDVDAARAADAARHQQEIETKDREIDSIRTEYRWQRELALDADDYNTDLRAKLSTAEATIQQHAARNVEWVEKYEMRSRLEKDNLERAEAAEATIASLQTAELEQNAIIASLAAQMERWRSWAQFVYLAGGPVTLDDQGLRDAVCATHDADTATLRAERDAAQQERDSIAKQLHAEVMSERERRVAAQEGITLKYVPELEAAQQENQTLREALKAAWCELIQHDDQPWVKTLAGQVRVVGLFAFPRPQESQP